MNKFIIAAVAASLIGSPAMAQYHGPAKPQPRAAAQIKHQPKPPVAVRAPAKPARAAVKYQPKPAPVQYRDNWKRGERFNQRQARNYKQIDYRQYNRAHKRAPLKAPPRGHHYVQSGNDIVLVAVATGIIASIFAGLAR